MHAICLPSDGGLWKKGLISSHNRMNISQELAMCPVKCFGSLSHTVLRRLLSTRRVTHKRLEDSTGDAATQGYLLTLDHSQLCNPEMPSISFSQLANREPWQTESGCGQGQIP